jgi:hypothetical protein
MAAHHQVRNAAGRNGVRLGLSPRGLLKANDPRRTVNDFAELSILLEVAICLDHFAEHEGPIDDRPEGARLESLGDVLTAALRRVSSPLVRRATQDTGRPSNRPVGDAAKARSDRSIQALHLMAQGTPLADQPLDHGADHIGKTAAEQRKVIDASHLYDSLADDQKNDLGLLMREFKVSGKRP